MSKKGWNKTEPKPQKASAHTQHTYLAKRGARRSNLLILIVVLCAGCCVTAYLYVGWLFWLAFKRFAEMMGSSVFGIIVKSAIVPCLVLLLKLLRTGKVETIKSYKKNIQDTAIVSFAVALGVYTYLLVYEVPQQINHLAVTIKPPTIQIAHPTIPTEMQEAKDRSVLAAHQIGTWAGFTEKVDEITVSLGTGGMRRGGRLQEGVVLPFISIGKLPIISAKLVAGIPQFFFKLWSPYSATSFSAKPPIEVNGTEVTIREPNWDRNFSSTEYEVVDDSGRPVFQLIRKTIDHFIVNGVFLIPNNPTVKYNFLYAGDNGWGMIDPRLFNTTGFRLTRIFKYPSRRHQGEYADK